MSSGDFVQISFSQEAKSPQCAHVGSLLSMAHLFASQLNRALSDLQPLQLICSGFIFHCLATFALSASSLFRVAMYASHLLHSTQQ
jgi:hypothetical protein